ncbi:GNAT family N-acetyltransferase [Aquibacillus sediminis]|uniref:GNAT family N-acetyltransferase n=1 Tax=Aquibacillus sediminis TaxID=2574734 RepID=UPI001486A032|nr:GNAT family N-acetyltransferase [Aquibacillus sediminis]
MRTIQQVLEYYALSSFDLNERYNVVSIEDFCGGFNKDNWEELKRFKCGNESRERFIAQSAFYYSIEFEGNTSLVLNKDNKVIAYFTLVQMEIRFPHSTFPCMEIARIATHSSNQRQGIGSYLISKIKKIAIQTNRRFLTLDAIKSRYEWYNKHNFLPIKEEEVYDTETKMVYMYHDLYDEDIVETFLDTGGHTP